MTSTQTTTTTGGGGGSLEGLPKPFVSAMRTLFDIMDDQRSGFVQFSEIERRWQDDGRQGLPRDVLASLRKVTPSDGYLSFERFCAGLQISLLRNKMGDRTDNIGIAYAQPPPPPPPQPPPPPHTHNRPPSAPLLDQHEPAVPHVRLAPVPPAPSGGHHSRAERTLSLPHLIDAAAPQRDHPPLHRLKTDIKMGVGGVLGRSGSAHPNTLSGGLNTLSGGHNTLSGSTIPATHPNALSGGQNILSGGLNALSGSTIPATHPNTLSGGHNTLSGNTIPATHPNALSGGHNTLSGNTIPATHPNALSGGHNTLSGSSIPATHPNALSGGQNILPGPPKPPRAVDREGAGTHSLDRNLDGHRTTDIRVDHRATHSLDRTAHTIHHERSRERERDRGEETRRERGWSLERYLDHPDTHGPSSGHGVPLRRAGIRSALQTWHKERTRDPSRDPRGDPRSDPSRQDPRNEARIDPTRPDPRGDPRSDPSRPDPRGDLRSDPTRPDPRGDPRNDPRSDPTRPDPRGDPRNDPRSDPSRPDPRGDPRNDPRSDPTRPDPRLDVNADDNNNYGSNRDYRDARGAVGGREERERREERRRDGDAAPPSLRGVGDGAGAIAPAPPHDTATATATAASQTTNTGTSHKKSRKREARRHTLQNGIDNNMLRRVKQLEAERDMFVQGYEVVERARSWYRQQLHNIADTLHYLPHSSTHTQEPSLEAQQEKLHFQLLRIHEVNGHLQALMDASEHGLAAHLTLAPQASQVRHTDNNNTRHNNDDDMDRLINRLKDQNHLLTEEVSNKSERITVLEREKAALLRELFQARTTSTTTTSSNTLHHHHHHHQQPLHSPPQAPDSTFM